MKQSGSANVSGFVAPGFEAVRNAFVENFTDRNDLGAAWWTKTFISSSV
jgi:hypothetical protein